MTAISVIIGIIAQKLTTYNQCFSLLDLKTNHLVIWRTKDGRETSCGMIVCDDNLTFVPFREGPSDDVEMLDWIELDDTALQRFADYIIECTKTSLTYS